MSTEDLGEALFAEADAEMRLDGASFEEVAAKLRKSAELGSTYAAYALGTWYLHGKGVSVDYREAVGFLQIAAGVHHHDALYELGACYFNGEGVEKNHDKAFDLYLKAALHGHEGGRFQSGASILFR